MGFASKIISDNLKLIRQERNMTLDCLAAITGVSKSMLSEIERCTKSPTIGVLEKICDGINIPLSQLTYSAPPKVEVVTNSTVTHYSAWEGFELFVLFPFDPQKKFEVFRHEVQPHSSRASEKHEAHIREYIICTQGTCTIQIESDAYVLKDGEAISFLASGKHSYKNETDTLCKYIMVLYHE